MPAYNFREEFAVLVQDGIMRQTVRRVRKRETRVGEELKLYQGMRQPNPLLLRAVSCRAITPVIISRCEGVALGGIPLTEDGREMFALYGGFLSFNSLLRFFEQTYGEKSFSGECLHWDVPTADVVRYAVLRLDYHLILAAKSGTTGDSGVDSFVETLRDSGIAYWQAPVGRVWAIREWRGRQEWDQALHYRLSAPHCIMDGRPEEWVRYC